jgi:sugar transferase (PEP-CTERM/EpsH1 system associated)
MQTQVQREILELQSGPTMAESAMSSGRLRILHVVPRLGMGGTEHGVLKVMNGLGERDFEQRICAVRGMDADFARRMKVAARTYSAGTPNPGFQFPLFRLAKIMKEFRPHIVHTRNFGALEGIAAARLARVPIAIHSEHGYELETIAGLPLRRRLLCRALYSMADAVFTVTADLRAYHARQSWLPAEGIQVIHNGVDTERFSPRPDEGRQMRVEFGIPDDRVVLGSVGRLVPIKDHATLLRAAEVLARQGKNIHVLLVGSGPERHKLEAYVAASPELAQRSTFAGASDRVPQLLNAMDIFVLPSVCEGMSNTLLEAMACGLPIVATTAGGNGEAADEGRSARLFPPGDVQALSEALKQLVDGGKTRTEFSNAARVRALQRFSLTGAIERYRALYLELASRRNLAKGN